MNIVKFSEQMGNFSEEFRQFWLEEHEGAEDKDEWPMEMEEHEWWEQFLTWISSKHGYEI